MVVFAPGLLGKSSVRCFQLLSKVGCSCWPGAARAAAIHITPGSSTPSYIQCTRECRWHAPRRIYRDVCFQSSSQKVKQPVVVFGRGQPENRMGIAVGSKSLTGGGVAALVASSSSLAVVAVVVVVVVVVPSLKNVKVNVSLSLSMSTAVLSSLSFLPTVEQ